ncbi:MarR family winged helix-turn-helix transcriptional regulator [Microbacterium sp. M28]|uniref:MarR family winged helix-turn-helix transcriptional regulator n=1 Tax=Microbacterium sp. M28 TaxID=2962064 RepID=UPI0021F41FDB|nr:MarR family winged helix-turn-helix transcriptional regulator [Microbacterium sp. M28]UYO97256.1 MarR family winged helix-turn-helix transcriptional regulator [Microbacterium sp. M28]
MSTPDPADDIADALVRLRGRRHPGHGLGHGGPHGQRGGPHEGRRGRPGGWPAGPGGRFAAPAWMRMLEALAAASDPLSVSEIAEAVGVDQPRASRLVQQGVERDLVRREADPDDARRTRIALTDAGIRVARGAKGERRQELSCALEAFTEDERTELARLLNKLADNWGTTP